MIDLTSLSTETIQELRMAYQDTVRMLRIDNASEKRVTWYENLVERCQQELKARSSA